MLIDFYKENAKYINVIALILILFLLFVLYITAKFYIVILIIREFKEIHNLFELPSDQIHIIRSNAKSCMFCHQNINNLNKYNFMHIISSYSIPAIDSVPGLLKNHWQATKCMENVNNENLSWYFTYDQYYIIDGKILLSKIKNAHWVCKIYFYFFDDFFIFSSITKIK